MSVNRVFVIYALALLSSLLSCSQPILRTIPLLRPDETEINFSPLPEVKTKEFKNFLGSILHSPFQDGNEVTTLENGEEIFPAMLEALNSAKKIIQLESYIAWDGKVATQFVEVLSRKAKEGVIVNMILDWHGSSEMSSSDIELLIASGAQVKFYNRLHWYDPSSWADIDRIDNRTHRRILTIDGEVAFTGGVGIADNWLGRGRTKEEWRDTHYKIIGPVVSQLMGIFAENWIEAKGEVPADGSYYSSQSTSGGTAMLATLSFPGQQVPMAELIYLAAIQSARSSIIIATPYFVPDEFILKCLRDASKRGVQVIIVTVGRNTDKEFVRASSRALWGDLLEAGIKIFEFAPTLYHRKLLLVDDFLSVIGTTNMDNRSFRLNDEVLVLALDAQFAASQRSSINEDLKHSEEVTIAAWKTRPLWERIADRISVIFRREL